MLLNSPRSWEISNMTNDADLRGLSLYRALMGLKPTDLAETEWAELAGVNRGFFTNLKKQDISPRSDTIRKLLRFIGKAEADLYSPAPEGPKTGKSESVKSDYVDVAVLPTFAGMGGGGTGDGDAATALISSSLIHHELRGKPSDFLLINVRGDSMEPDFRHGDQLLVDTRDTSPAQPGPFALWDGEWGEYVVKNVERAEGGRVRMFSTNTKYAPSEIDHEATRIIGRPVWFARRL